MKQEEGTIPAYIGKEFIVFILMHSILILSDEVLLFYIKFMYIAT